jgi:hypothetical protein
MTAFNPQQRHLSIGDRTFHFVSYEAHPPNERRGELGGPAMWYLMVEGRRCPALAYDPVQDLEEVDRELELWVQANALAPAAAGPSR